MRTVVAEFITKMTALGLVQTSDTGQIDTATATRPAPPGISGYAIFRFPDSSLFLKFEFGPAPSAGTAGNPSLYLTVGTGSDGAGTLTGTLSSRVNSKGTTTGASGISTIVSTSANYGSYAYLDDDRFWIVWKAFSGGSNVYPVAAFYVSKWNNSLGGVDSNGFLVRTGYGIGSQGAGAAAYLQSVRLSPSPGIVASSGSYCIVPGNLTTSTVGSDKQYFLHAYPTTPRCIFDVGVITTINSEAPHLTTFTATPVGSTPHTYISMETLFGGGNCASLTASWGHSLMWVY